MCAAAVAVGGPAIATPPTTCGVALGPPRGGNYIGTATTKAYGFTSLNAAQTTDDTVALTYKTPGACNACEPAAITDVRYRWQGDHVVMLDRPPPSQ
jgi:hypothetical protein